MSYFVLYRAGDSVKAARIDLPATAEYLPTVCHYAGRQYRQVNPKLENYRDLLNSEDLDHYDHLVNSKGELAGFAYVLADARKVGAIRLVKECNNVRIDENIWLKFIFAQDKTLTPDSAQVFPTDVYFDGISDYILFLHQWWPESKPVAFDLETENVPSFGQA